MNNRIRDIYLAALKYKMPIYDQNLVACIRIFIMSFSGDRFYPETISMLDKNKDHKDWSN